MSAKTTSHSRLKRWSVTEEIRTPGEIKKEVLQTFWTKLGARRWMFDHANAEIKQNPLLTRHPTLHKHDIVLEAHGKVEAGRNEISMKIYSRDSYHQRFLKIEKL